MDLENDGGKRIMCDCLDRLEKNGELLDLPFERPILLTSHHQLKVGRWAVRLMRKTAAGRPTLSKSKLVFLNFCFICGASMLDEEVYQYTSITDGEERD